MFYTTEEAAIVCGFLNLYLDRASVDVSVRRRNAAFQLGAATETLQPEDYRWAENVLCFLKPCWWQLHEDHRAVKNVILKTHLLAQKEDRGRLLSWLEAYCYTRIWSGPHYIFLVLLLSPIRHYFPDCRAVERTGAWQRPSGI